MQYEKTGEAFLSLPGLYDTEVGLVQLDNPSEQTSQFYF